jgi:phosphate transport system substrate-binding protein
LLVAACGGSSSGSSSSATPAPSASVQTGNPSSAVTLNESGSTLLLPYLQAMVGPVKQAYPNITLAPSGGGSGKGVSDSIAGTVQMGGSDAYLADAQAKQNPDLLNIPIAVSSQAINYNLPGVSDLKLTGNVLAQIYNGKINKWNDSQITKLNPGVNLPSQTIVPIRRVDASGDTFIFTSFLSATNNDWNNGPSLGTTVTWPAAQGELTASGNPGMVQQAKAIPGSIAYVGVSAEQTALGQGLGEAQLQNKAGQYVKPTQQTTAAAAQAKGTNVPADLRASLIYADGAQSYPIVNYEYLLVKSKQSDSNTALALRTFLSWAVNPSQGMSAQNLQAVNFVALPAPVQGKVKGQIAKIQAGS